MIGTDLLVLVPSRGRPEAAAELVKTFEDTCTLGTRLMFVVDHDDDRAGYMAAIQGKQEMATVCVVNNTAHTMVFALNEAARFAVNSLSPAPWAVGFMGDDHRPRTPGWDQAYVSALREPGVEIAYGDDLYQRQNLPTQVAMTAELVRVLGFMAPDVLRHMYVDNFWKDLGTAAGCLKYLHEIVVEHLHPAANKAEWDEGYRRVNDPAVYRQDQEAYEGFRRSHLAELVDRVKGSRTRSQLGAFDRRPSTRGGYVQESIPESDDGHEWRLFEEGTVPAYTTPEWYQGREHAPHLDQPVHRDRLHASATFVAQAAFQGRLKTVVDLGAGDGGLLSLLGPRIKAWGYDLTPENVEAAKARGVDVRLGDVLAPGIEWGEIAVATEMLEHLINPHDFLSEILDHSQALVCSSPWDERPGKAYEFHTWAWDLEGYRGMIERAGWKVLRQRRVHRFQVVMAVRP